MSYEPRGMLRPGTRDIVAAGMLAGALDFVFATTLWGALGVPPQIIPQSVASGLLGAGAFNGGIPAIVLGSFLHFAIAVVIAAIYALAPLSARNRPALMGPAYGAAVWFVMTRIVVPLSAAPLKPPPALVQGADLAAHMLLVGLPIAWLCRPGKPASPRSQHHQ